MSRQLISLSPDLLRLQNDGYDLGIKDGYLLVRDVPYVTEQKTVARGVLATRLELAGDVTVRPNDHTVRFGGSIPCDLHGQPLHRIINGSGHEVLTEGVEVDHSFSSKPAGGYADYHAKMTTYANILCGHARAIDPHVTAMTFPVVEADVSESVFRYEDTSSSRSDIGAINAKLRVDKVAIVGCGGTGAYVLDMLAKTPISEIHLFDGDKFLQHNAFRSPGAPSAEELKLQSLKVDYLAGIYSRMHRHVIPHGFYLDEDRAAELDQMSFVFFCLDRASAKRVLVDRLKERGIPFVDAGMGVYQVDGTLAGIVRLTTGTPGKYDHIEAKHRIPFGEALQDEYATNIQIADLNALNATLAVIRWKKQLGFYADFENEHFSTYTINGNHLINEDQA